MGSFFEIWRRARVNSIISIVAALLLVTGSVVAVMLVQTSQEIRQQAGNTDPGEGTASYCGGTSTMDCSPWEFNGATSCVHSCQCGYSSGACGSKSEGSNCYIDQQCGLDNNSVQMVCVGGRKALEGEFPSNAVYGTCTKVSEDDDDNPTPPPPSCPTGWKLESEPLTCTSPNTHGIFRENGCKQCRERQRINANVTCLAQQGCICANGPDVGKPKTSDTSKPLSQRKCAAILESQCYKKDHCSEGKETVPAAQCLEPDYFDTWAECSAGSTQPSNICYRFKYNTNGSLGNSCESYEESVSVSCTDAEAAGKKDKFLTFSRCTLKLSQEKAKSIPTPEPSVSPSPWVPNPERTACYDALTESCKLITGKKGEVCLNEFGENRHYQVREVCLRNRKNLPIFGGTVCGSVNGCICKSGPDADKSLSKSVLCPSFKQACEVKLGGANVRTQRVVACAGSWSDEECDCKVAVVPSPDSEDKDDDGDTDVKDKVIDAKEQGNQCIVGPYSCAQLGMYDSDQCVSCAASEGKCCSRFRPSNAVCSLGSTRCKDVLTKETCDSTGQWVEVSCEETFNGNGICAQNQCYELRSDEPDEGDPYCTKSDGTRAAVGSCDWRRFNNQDILSTCTPTRGWVPTDNANFCGDVPVNVAQDILVAYYNQYLDFDNPDVQRAGCGPVSLKMLCEAMLPADQCTIEAILELYAARGDELERGDSGTTLTTALSILTAHYNAETNTLFNHYPTGAGDPTRPTEVDIVNSNLMCQQIGSALDAGADAVWILGQFYAADANGTIQYFSHHSLAVGVTGDGTNCQLVMQDPFFGDNVIFTPFSGAEGGATPENMPIGSVYIYTGTAVTLPGN